MPSQDSSPGRELQEFIRSIYASVEDPLLTRLDFHLAADGELRKLVVDSCINYVVRRLITAAEYFRREYPVCAYGQSRHVKELRSFLTSYTHYSARQIEEMLRIIVRCLVVSDDEPTQREKTKLRKEAEAYGLGCSVCGADMDFTSGSLAPAIAISVPL